MRKTGKIPAIQIMRDEANEAFQLWAKSESKIGY